MTGIFVTGTGTDVGKTVVSLALCALIKSLGKTPGYFKPVQCGTRELGGGKSGGDGDWVQSMCPFAIQAGTGYDYESPVSPHLAAEWENRPIEFGTVKEGYKLTGSGCDFVVCEGAGGIAVPLNRRGFDMAEMAKLLEIPVLLVCLPGLGTLHHSITSYHYGKSAGLDIAGFIMCQSGPEKPDIFSDNTVTIEQSTGLPYWGEVGYACSLEKNQKLSSSEIDELTSGFTSQAAQWFQGA